LWQTDDNAFVSGTAPACTVSNNIVDSAKILVVPTSTDNRIEGLYAEIRALCGEPFSSQTEAQLRKLARELRMEIRQHVDMAKSSLTVKKTAIAERDPDEK
jgi:hypothetical protein